MNKALTILLFSLIGISSVGIYPIFKLLQLQAKEDVEETLKRGLPLNKLQQFGDREMKEIVWEREGKEFHYHEEMYDVVKTETIDGKTTYYCFNDTRESKIFNNLQDLICREIGNERTHTGAAAKILIQLMSQVYIPGNGCVLPAAIASEIHQFNPHYHNIEGTLVADITSPPPEA